MRVIWSLRSMNYNVKFRWVLSTKEKMKGNIIAVFK